MNRFLQFIHKMNDRIGQWVSFATLLLVLIGSGNAIARYLGKFIGLQLSSNVYLELQWYLFSLLFLLGAARTLQRDAHVRVDVFYGRLSKKGKAWLDLAGTVLFMIPFCILLIWSSLPTVLHSWQSLEMSPDPGGLARYPIKTLLPLAFTLLLLQAICLAVTKIQEIRQREEPSDAA
jgi:TRAP-type mannitol/chloroaromatic compound transport system permease small subunit